MQSIILTPNRRLAVALREQHQQAQLQQGKLCWQTQPVMPLVSWLENLWLGYTQYETNETPSLLLTSYQEQIIWEDIIRQSPQSEHLLQVSRTAKKAASAWELLKQWNIPLDHPELNLTEDSQHFLSWAKSFQKICRQNNWLDHASIPNSIREKYTLNNKLLVPQHIILTGFIDIPPQIKILLDHFASLGAEVTQTQPKESNQSTSRITLKDKEDEILTMARWAKSTYEANDFNNINIGCIIPDLDNSREQIKRIFHEVFKDYPELVFNISAGKPLITYPVIFTALRLFSLTEEEISIDVFNHLLRSPFLGEAETEMQQRALYARYLQNKNLTFVSSEDLQHCPKLLKNRIEKIRKSHPKSNQSPSAWVSYLNEILLQLGWPGERSLNSEEYQIIQNGWKPLLNSFATLDLIFESISQTKALHYLSVIAESIIFQPQSPKAPIQILGTLEAAGLSFDYLWMMGMNDRSWPPLPSPNPFIPHRLQKQLNMPNASSERELAYCQKLTSQFVLYSQNVIFSHSEQDKEITLRPSALIKIFPQIVKDQILSSAYTSTAEKIHASHQIEKIDDFIGPTINTNDILHGGVSIFKLQALCPFKAFSELRLHAHFVEPPSGGLRAQDRGKLLHKTLELCWSELKNSDQLQALDLNKLENLIINCIDRAYTETQLTHLKKNQRYLQIEKKRLTKILLEWFLVEKDRPSFQVIACEIERTVTIGPINFKLRIDRIDQLENGEKLIIDYKTGKNNQIKSWFGDRPDEPQLPLYCVTEYEPVSAIAFAELHPTLIGFKGISKQQSDIAGIKSLSETKQTEIALWAEQLNQWDKVLTTLGHNFYQGVATVDPKDPMETCRQCHLQSLCRIYE